MISSLRQLGGARRVVADVAVARACNRRRVAHLPGRSPWGSVKFNLQGFVDASGPLCLRVKDFGVAMEYNLFILATVKESYGTHADPPAPWSDWLACRVALSSPWPH